VPCFNVLCSLLNEMLAHCEPDLSQKRSLPSLHFPSLPMINTTSLANQLFCYCLQLLVGNSQPGRYVDFYQLWLLATRVLPACAQEALLFSSMKAWAQQLETQVSQNYYWVVLQQRLCAAFPALLKHCAELETIAVKLKRRKFILRNAKDARV
jgi:hypothetical protein